MLFAIVKNGRDLMKLVLTIVRAYWEPLMRAKGFDDHSRVVYFEDMKRLLLLLPTATYRTKAFLDAALSLDIAVTAASEKANTLAASNPAALLTLDLYHPAQAAVQAQKFAQTYPL